MTAVIVLAALAVGSGLILARAVQRDAAQSKARHHAMTRQPTELERIGAALRAVRLAFADMADRLSVSMATLAKALRS